MHEKGFLKDNKSLKENIKQRINSWNELKKLKLFRRNNFKDGSSCLLFNDTN